MSEWVDRQVMGGNKDFVLPKLRLNDFCVAAYVFILPFIFDYHPTDVQVV